MNTPEREALTAEELEAEEVAELPDREAMTLIKLAGSPELIGITPSPDPLPPGEALPGSDPLPPGEALPDS